MSRGLGELCHDGPGEFLPQISPMKLAPCFLILLALVLVVAAGNPNHKVKDTQQRAQKLPGAAGMAFPGVVIPGQGDASSKSDTPHGWASQQTRNMLSESNPVGFLEGVSAFFSSLFSGELANHFRSSIVVRSSHCPAVACLQRIFPPLVNNQTVKQRQHGL